MAYLLDCFKFGGPLKRSDLWIRLIGAWLIGMVLLAAATGIRAAVLRSTPPESFGVALGHLMPIVIVWGVLMWWVILAAFVRRGRQLTRKALIGYFILLSIFALPNVLYLLGDYRWSTVTFDSAVGRLGPALPKMLGLSVWFFGFWRAPHEPPLDRRWKIVTLIVIAAILTDPPGFANPGNWPRLVLNIPSKIVGILPNVVADLTYLLNGSTMGLSTNPAMNLGILTKTEVVASMITEFGMVAVLVSLIRTIRRRPETARAA